MAVEKDLPSEIQRYESIGFGKTSVMICDMMGEIVRNVLFGKESFVIVLCGSPVTY